MDCCEKRHFPAVEKPVMVIQSRNVYDSGLVLHKGYPILSFPAESKTKYMIVLSIDQVKFHFLLLNQVEEKLLNSILLPGESRHLYLTSSSGNKRRS